MSIYTPRIEDTFAFVSDDGTQSQWVVLITPEGTDGDGPQIIEVTNADMTTRIYRLDEDQTEKVRLRLKVKLRERGTGGKLTL